MFGRIAGSSAESYVTSNGGHTEQEIVAEGGSEAAEKGVIEAIITNQTADVDTVSGATNSSKGIIEAVNAALADAK